MWPPYSNIPLFALDGIVSEPLSGRFSIICRPEDGGEGIQCAIRNCDEGGSILLREGVYLVTERLRLDRAVHIFGQGKAELRGGVPGGYMVHSTSSSATLDRIRIDSGIGKPASTLHIPSGHLRLQGCDVSSRSDQVHSLVDAAGSSTLADMLGCSFSGGGFGVFLGSGASGRIEGCGFRGVGKPYYSGICFEDTGTPPFVHPLVSRNVFRDYANGVLIASSVEASWALGEGNIFINCADGGVFDDRVPALDPVPDVPA